MSRCDQVALKAVTILNQAVAQLKTDDRSGLPGHIAALEALLPKLRKADRAQVETALEDLRSLNVVYESRHAIRTRKALDAPWGRPALGKMRSDEPDKVYWWGNTWSDELRPDCWEIVTTYNLKPHLTTWRKPDGTRERWLDQISLEIAFYQDFPRQPQQETAQATGFLGPDGGFYTCHWQEHAGLSEVLVKCFHPDDYHDTQRHVSRSESPADILKAHGWLLIYPSGYVVWPREDGVADYAVTEEQRATLARLAQVGDEKWRRNIGMALRWTETPNEQPDDLGEMEP